MPQPPPPSAAVRDAVVAVIAEHGLEGTSVRRVAARAGVSVGAVQHHYRSKDAMLAAAADRVEEVHRQRLRAEAARLSDRPEALLRATVRSLVPPTTDERADTALWLAFVGRAAVHDATAEQHRRTWRRAEEDLARLVLRCAAPAAGVPGAPGTPPGWARDVAAELLALVDGLSVAVLLEPARMPPERARRLVDRAVDRAVDQATVRASRSDAGRRP